MLKFSRLLVNRMMILSFCLFFRSNVYICFCFFFLSKYVGASSNYIFTLWPFSSLSSRWERRIDHRGRVYYVDHNTRTTTWQRPNLDMVQNWQNWQQWRNNRTMEQLQQRFLFPNNPAINPDNDPLGVLPDGWGRLLTVLFPQGTALWQASDRTVQCWFMFLSHT